MISPQSACPLHPTAPLLSYSGQQWCRFCAANKQRVVDQASRYLTLTHWGIVASVPIFFVGLAALAPVIAGLPVGEQPRNFWWWLLLPTTFVTSCLVLLLGHITIRLWQRAKNASFALLPWFHATHALRDGAVIALLSSPVYAFLLYFGKDLPLIGVPQGSVRGWLLWRAPLIFCTTFAALKAATYLKWVTPETLVPPINNQDSYISWYGLLLVGIYLPISSLFANLAVKQPGVGILTAAVALGLVATVVYLALLIYIRTQAAKLGGAHKGPIPSTIAIVGPSNTGKTVFFCRAYSLLQATRRGMVNLNPTPQSLSAISSHIDTLENKREWPPPTVQADEVPFSLYHGLKEMIQFNWLDLPGGVFNQPNAPQFQSQAQKFNQHLINSDAVAMLIDANDLVKGLNGAMPYEQIYQEVARQLYSRLQQVGQGARPVPLAIIVTQCCRVEPNEVLRFPARLENLANLWQNLSVQVGLPRPPVKIFLSSAVINDNGKNNAVPSQPSPLRSQNCMEPVIWLAAQTMRLNMGLVDAVQGFSGKSDLQLAVLRLEALCRDSLKG